MMQELGEQELPVEDTPAQIHENSRVEHPGNNSMDSKYLKNMDSVRNG
jgi:hypothetical protein